VFLTCMARFGFLLLILPALTESLRLCWLTG
jgi:hypothetical protein